MSSGHFLHAFHDKLYRELQKRRVFCYCSIFNIINIAKEIYGSTCGSVRNDWLKDEREVEVPNAELYKVIRSDVETEG